MRLLALVLLALPAHAGVLWHADFESQDLSEWDSYVLHPEHWYFAMTPAPRSGQYVARVELHTEDTYGANFQRAEVEYSAPLSGFEGSDVYYAFSAQLSSANPFLPMDHEIAFWESTGGSVYHQMIGIHVDPTNSPARVSMSVDPEDGNWSETWHSTMSVDAWHDFVVHVKWSLDPSVGFVEAWYDGTQVMQKQTMRTMVSQNGTTSMTGGLVSAFHSGILLSPIQQNKPVEVVYLDRFIEGTALSDVVYSAPADAGSPPPMDAGVPADAGSQMSDAGSPMPDAGMQPAPDAGHAPSDAGTPHDAGTSSGSDGGSPPDNVVGGMGCQATFAAPALWLVLLVARRRDRRRQHAGFSRHT
jgi:hypothetical protein